MLEPTDGAHDDVVEHQVDQCGTGEHFHRAVGPLDDLLSDTGDIPDGYQAGKCCGLEHQKDRKSVV